MRDTKATLLSKWFQEVWNEGRREAIDELLAENITAHGLGPDGHTKGIEAFKSFYDDFRNQLSDVQVLVEDVVSQDDVETALCKVTAVHIPTGKRVNFSGICMAKIQDGKIAEAWNQYDFLKMYQQIGYELTPP